MATQRLNLTRDVLAKIAGIPAGKPPSAAEFQTIKQLELLFGNVDSASDIEFLTVDDASATFPNSRVLEFVDPLVATDGGAGGVFSVNLRNTPVAPGEYGGPTKAVRFVVTPRGRINDAEEYDLDTDNITEGGSNLYFTTDRARTAISGTGGIDYDSASGVIDTQGFTGTVGPVDFDKGIAQSGTAVAGFTGTGAYTNFTIQDGLITSAS